MNNELQSKAIEWFVRLRGPQLSTADKQELEAWLSGDASHRSAYAHVERNWQDLEGLQSWACHELRQLANNASQSWGASSTMPAKTGIQFLSRWFITLTGTAIVAVLIFAFLPLIWPQVDHYSTQDGEQRRIVLADGSRIHLNAASAMDVRFDGDLRHVRLLKGEGLFDVAKDANRPFVVEVRGSRVVVIGTRFNVYYREDLDVDITVVEGRIAVLPIGERSGAKMGDAGLLLEPGRQARIDAMGHVEALREVDPAVVTSWDKGMLIFNGTPLREVAREISRYVPGGIQVATNVPDYPVTGIIKLRDKKTMVSVLTEVVPVTPVRASSQVVMLFKAPDKVFEH